MNSMKKKAMITLISASALLGGAQAYATIVLDSNIVQLIRSGVATIQSYFVGDAKKSVTQDLKSDYQKKINDYVANKTNEIISDVENHKNNEISRANSELNTYFEAMKKDVDEAAQAEVQKAKDAVTEEVNKDIGSVKTEMMAELEKAIKNKMKK